MTPPNILFMIPHDLGTFLNCYGNPRIKSPNLDRMAADGVSFSNYFTTTAECGPSRAATMTGLMPHRNGMMGLPNFGWKLRAPHLAQSLKELGYATRHFGFQHEIHGPAEALGYDRSIGEGGNKVEAVCENLREFLRSPEAADGPWFAYAGFQDVHRPWPRAERFGPDDVDVPSWLPDRETTRRDLARLYQNIEDMDAAVGTVLDTLAETGLDDDTLTIFSSDHGAAFPGAKATMYDPGIRIPLIARQPGRVEGGAVVDQLVSCVDLTPTLLEVAGGAPSKELDGRAFTPLFTGEELEARDQVCGALMYDVAYDPVHYIRTKGHKYIKSFAARPEDAAGADLETLTSFAAGRWIRVDDFDVLTSPSWQALKPERKPPKPDPEELYDLEADPDERNNLARDPKHAAVLADMRLRLREMMKRTDSPLLRGHVQPPEAQRAAARSHGANSPKSMETIGKRRELINSS